MTAPRIDREAEARADEGAWTPGPWHYGDEDTMFGVDFVQVHAGDYGNNTFRRIANVEAPFDGERDLPMDAETRANARLIAAAPELVKALRSLLEELWDDRHSHMNREQFERDYEREFALLARIDGGEQ